jgi:Molecular chaperone
MDTPRKVYVGYDLCEDYTQINCYSFKTNEPVPISYDEDEEHTLIPTLLCLKTSTKQWLFGEEALTCAASGAGILVEHLLKKVSTGEDIELLGQTVSVESLLEIYLRRTLSIVKRYFPTEPITKLVITLPYSDTLLVEKLYEALASLGLEKDRVIVMNHTSAYLYYALSQAKELWLNDVGLFDFNKEGLCYYQIRMNRRSTPMIAEIMKSDLTDTMNLNTLEQLKAQRENPSYVMESMANNILYKQIITTLYFTGCGFDGGWAEPVIKNLCVGRRVFFGQNLYSMGACHAAKELSGEGQLENFVLLNDEMLTSSLYLRVYCDTAYKEEPLLKAGDNWYEVNQNMEVILAGEPYIDLVKKNIMTREVNYMTFALEQIPIRPDRMTRLRINMTCKDKMTGLLRITDMGFGEFQPATEWGTEFTIEI